MPIDGSQDSEIHVETIPDYTIPDWQVNPTSDNHPDLLSDTEDEGSDVYIDRRGRGR